MLLILTFLKSNQHVVGRSLSVNVTRDELITFCFASFCDFVSIMIACIFVDLLFFW